MLIGAASLSICSSQLEYITARYICGQLGYPDALNYSSFGYSGLQFDVGSTRWLTDVICFGNEPNIMVILLSQGILVLHFTLYILLRNAYTTLHIAVIIAIQQQYRVVRNSVCKHKMCASSTIAICSPKHTTKLKRTW